MNNEKERKTNLFSNSSVAVEKTKGSNNQDPNIKNKSNKKNNYFNFYAHKQIVLFITTIIIGFCCFCVKNFGFNEGIDFSGGIVIEATCEKCNMQQITKQSEKKLKQTVIYQEIDSGYLLKTTASKENNETLDTFVKFLHQNDITIINTDYTSPQMSKTFIKDSIYACIFAFICLSLYIIIRFNIKFAICCIAVLVIDILATTAFISFSKIELCLTTLMAVLTIIGYGINDKIVVFDRIKGNLSLTATQIPEIIKSSIKSVLFRSIFTSATTIIASLSLFFLKDRLIYEFELTIIFGIIFSTISSLVIAPSLLSALHIKYKPKAPEIKDPMWYAS